MIVRFHREATRELESARLYYDSQRLGLGKAFVREVKLAVQRIKRQPRSWSLLLQRVRRCRTNRFPYGVVYTHSESEITVLAVMHLKRKPGYWKDRLSE